jgi:methylglutaconyl-CoA hydratase
MKARLVHRARRAATIVLTLHRPERRNALSQALAAELTAALVAVGDDEDVRAVVVTGAPPAFCAGLDLRELARNEQAADAYDVAWLEALYATIRGLPVPVIAAVNGAALAGGAALVTACDLAVAADSATFGYPGVRHGLVAPIVIPDLVAVVGLRRAQALLLTGATITAAEALEFGLVGAVVPDADVLNATLNQAAVIATSPRAAVAATKQALRVLSAPDLTPEQRRAVVTPVTLTGRARERIERFLDT